MALNRCKAVIIGATSLFIGIAVPANADIYNVTYTGTITSGGDTFNSFGLGYDLTGDSFTAAFTFDSSKLINPGFNGPYDNFYDSTTLANPASFDFKIGNLDITKYLPTLARPQDIFDVEDVAFKNTVNPGDYSDRISEIHYIDADSPTQFYDLIVAGHAPGNTLNQPLETPENIALSEYPGDEQGIGDGSFYGSKFQPDGTLVDFGITFKTDHLTVTAPSAAVPEPASWAMMVGGTGFIGGAMRRRRRVAANAVLA